MSCKFLYMVLFLWILSNLHLSPVEKREGKQLSHRYSVTANWLPHIFLSYPDLFSTFLLFFPFLFFLLVLRHDECIHFLCSFFTLFEGSQDKLWPKKTCQECSQYCLCACYIYFQSPVEKGTVKSPFYIFIGIAYRNVAKILSDNT